MSDDWIEDEDDIGFDLLSPRMEMWALRAAVGDEFEFLSSRGDFKGSPQGIRRDYAMAVLLRKLALVRSYFDSRSDHNDLDGLNELISLENSAQELVAKHFAGRDPLEIARSKCHEIEAWMQSVENIKQAVKQECSIVPQASALQLPSQSELADMQLKLEENLAKLAVRLQAQVDCLPVDVAVNGVVLSELSELAAMDVVGSDYKTILRMAEAAGVAAMDVVRADYKQPDMMAMNDVQPRLVLNMESAIVALQKWQDQFKDHEQLLQSLASDLEAGHLSAAAVNGEMIGERKFAGLNYQPVTDLQFLESALKELEVAKRWKAAQLIKELRAKYPKAEAQSELIHQINKHQTRSTSEMRKALLVALFLFGLIATIGKVVVYSHREQQQLAAVAKAKAEAELRAITAKLQSTSLGTQLEIPLTETVRQLFIVVPSGSFTMGSSSSEEKYSSDEGLVDVTLSQSFWLAKTEVTQAQWEVVMGSNPSQFKGANLPVENVSWDDAQSFIAKLSDKQILPQGWKFALPTEAQWEYACRAGGKGPYSGGSLDEVGWYNGNSGSKIHEVGQKKPNAWGLQDMHGNVLEWCADWYAERLQGGVDPTGPSSGADRVNRGGSWNSYAYVCRAAERRRYYSGYRLNFLGFRPALVPSK